MRYKTQENMKKPKKKKKKKKKTDTNKNGSGLAAGKEDPEWFF